MVSVATKCYDDFATDMKLADLLAYANLAKNLTTETISFYAVPGQAGSYNPQGITRSYYSIHKQEYVDLINDHFLPYEEYYRTVDDLKIEELHSSYESNYLTNDEQGLEGYINGDN